jgi:cell division protein DivIC
MENVLHKLMNSFRNRPVLLRNKFVIMGLIFLVWMIFFDKNNLITYGKLYATEYQLKKNKRNYQQSILEINQALEDLQENTERFAREKYFMHRSNEEVFVIIKN